jgi:regulator of replication initiation timing
MSDTLNESLESYMTAYKQMSELAALREENAALNTENAALRELLERAKWHLWDVIDAARKL